MLNSSSDLNCCPPEQLISCFNIYASLKILSGIEMKSTSLKIPYISYLQIKQHRRNLILLPHDNPSNIWRNPFNIWRRLLSLLYLLFPWLKPPNFFSYFPYNVVLRNVTLLINCLWMSQVFFNSSKSELNVILWVGFDHYNKEEQNYHLWSWRYSALINAVYDWINIFESQNIIIIYVELTMN